MQNTGWRTIIIDKHCELSLDDGCIKVVTDLDISFYALSQIRNLLLLSQQARISTALINELVERNIGCVICDNKKNPSVQAIPLRSHSARHNYLDQCDWTQKRKDEIWTVIVEKKIQNQIALLDAIGAAIPPELISYANSVELGDKSGREAIAARTYFRVLFGNNHSRWEDSDITAALNYGYSILSSMINRIVASHGYCTGIGIHHKSRENPFNLSYDLIEPFRPIVDAIVYENRKLVFDTEYKRRFFDLYRVTIQYGDRFLDLQSAMDWYILDVFKSLGGEETVVKELIL